MIVGLLSTTEWLSDHARTAEVSGSAEPLARADLPLCWLDIATGSGQAAFMAGFSAHLRNRVMDALKSLDAPTCAETYAVSLFVYDYCDDPRRPTLTVGTNTEGQVRLHDETGEDAEVRWNYAFWLQNQLAVIGEKHSDPEGAQMCRAWIESQGFWFEDPDLDAGDKFDGFTFDEMIAWYSTSHADADQPRQAASHDCPRECEIKAKRITESFVRLCVSTAQELHASGLIEELFGRPIPVIVHELEYYDEIAQQNIEANGPTLAAGLVDWIVSSQYGFAEPEP